MPMKEMNSFVFHNQDGPLDHNQRLCIHWSKIYEDALTNIPEEKRGDRFVENILIKPDKCDIFFAKLNKEYKRDKAVLEGKRHIRPKGYVREINYLSMEKVYASRQQPKIQQVVTK